VIPNLRNRIVQFTPAVQRRSIVTKRRTKGTRILTVETRTLKVEYKNKNRLPVNDANERERTQYLSICVY
jgi:hypothetical protein